MLSDGQYREEKGELREIGTVKVYDVTGLYIFKGTDGKKHRVEYTATAEEGYKAIITGKA